MDAVRSGSGPVPSDLHIAFPCRGAFLEVHSLQEGIFAVLAVDGQGGQLEFFLFDIRFLFLLFLSVFLFGVGEKIQLDGRLLLRDFILREQGGSGDRDLADSQVRVRDAVEESEGMDLENVTDYEKKLRSSVPENIRIAKLHGRMRPADKERIMNEFAAHETDILISTTVIEVGIDVPNATVIIIENAERFGLSQLHQLRGRVGRGSGQSYCIFLYSADLPQKPKRLEILEQSNDGFYIAEQDLKLRGPGDVFGVRQSGEFGFVLGDVIGDADIMMEASRYADKVLTEHPERIPAGSKSVDFRSI